MTISATRTRPFEPARAEAAQAALDHHFWDPARGMYRNVHPRDASRDETFHYWWQAHALDALVDAYERTGRPEFRTRTATLVQALVARNGGHLFNDFYDDMAWMGLALLRASGAFGNTRCHVLAHDLWDRIREGWSEVQGGGIAWRGSRPEYKNAPANGPAAILAARLHGHDHDPEHLAWARRIFAWLQDTLVDPDTGFVWDGINREGDGRIDESWRFTYNQGVVIGAAVELHRITGEARFREAAARTAGAALSLLRDPRTGLLPDEGDGDGGLFKGILIRYLGEFARAQPPQFEVLDALQVNAEALWRVAAPQALFGTDWAAPPQGSVDLSSQLSGVMLFEQIARLASDREDGPVEP